MGRAQKAKGSVYENKLVDLLKDLGYGAYRVPLSGAIGHSKAGENLPPNLRAALSGDVACELTAGRYLPFEVKYRQDAASFRTLYNHMDQYGYEITAYSDCVVYPEADVDTLLRRYLTLHDHRANVRHAFPGLNKTTNDWFVGSEVLALKAHREPWLFVVRKENHVHRPEPRD